MKKLILSFSLATVMLLFVSCDHGNSLSPDVAQTASSGTWRVSLFVNSGNDKTPGFSGYTFTFSANAVIIAAKGGMTQNGTWSVSNSSAKFTINMGPRDNTNLPLGELTDDWNILSASETEIRLGDDNVPGQEFLTFTKN